MKQIKLTENAYNKLREKILKEESDPLYDVRTAFEDFYAAFKNAVIETSNYDDEGNKDYHPLLSQIKDNINFDAIEDILYKA